MRTSQLAMAATTLMALACGSSSSEPAAEAPEAGAPVSAAAPGTAEAPAAEAPPAEAAPQASGPELPGYEGRFHDGGSYEPHELARLDKASLRVLRNEIYARYGRAFASEDLQQHFGAQSWYQVREDYADTLLTDHDRAQAALIQSFETDDLDPVALGEFAYGPDNYVFAAEDMLLVFDASFEGYGMSPAEYAFRVHGEWVLSWEAGEAYRGQEATLMHLDAAEKTVTELTRMPASAG